MWYAQPSSRPLQVTVALTFAAQYDSNGVVKPFRHPERLRVLRQKASYADVVSTVFSVGSLSRIMSLQVSLSASKDSQRAQETHRGGALRCVSLIQLIFLVHHLSYAIRRLFIPWRSSMIP
jgi:hypothetical protein